MAMMVRRNLEMAPGLATVFVASLCEMVGQIGFFALAFLTTIRLMPLTREFFWSIIGGLALALAFYVWFLSHFGTRQVLGYLRLAGWGLLLTISLEAVARVANTCGWWVTIGKHGNGLRFRKLFAARIAGEAIDYVTPSAQIGG